MWSLRKCGRTGSGRFPGLNSKGSNSKNSCPQGVKLNKSREIIFDAQRAESSFFAPVLHSTNFCPSSAILLNSGSSHSEYKAKMAAGRSIARCAQTVRLAVTRTGQRRTTVQGKNKIDNDCYFLALFCEIFFSADWFVCALSVQSCLQVEVRFAFSIARVYKESRIRLLQYLKAVCLNIFVKVCGIGQEFTFKQIFRNNKALYLWTVNLFLKTF